MASFGPHIIPIRRNLLVNLPSCLDKAVLTKLSVNIVRSLTWLRHFGNSPLPRLEELRSTEMNQLSTRHGVWKPRNGCRSSCDKGVKAVGQTV